MQFSDDIQDSLLQRADDMAVAELCDPSSEWFKELLVDNHWHDEVLALVSAAMIQGIYIVPLIDAADAFHAKVRADAFTYIRGDGWQHAHRCYHRLRDEQ